MNKMISGLLLGLTLASGAVAAAPDADPVVGTWVLNVSRSAFPAGMAPQGQTRTYAETEQGISLTMKTTAADGRESTTTTTFHLDGKDNLVSNSPAFDVVVGTRLDANTTVFTLKKDGKVVGTTRRTVSADGRTLTATGEIVGKPGATLTEYSIYDRQT